ncbi:hypothetical protein LCM20_13055 [Halobacillus litoralis]|uniref:hypothetical protein n=1 Tax=Halobacillus litoralis TaxID=45668 RepID=UPI001CD3C0B1|nr:hypothetical protein [Halobacillus litoralis]MCA0971528.1 hypothetical protein [Halobacillus litoralis]
MMCVHCQYEQEAGNYCTVCGTPFYDSLTVNEPEPAYQIIETHEARTDFRSDRHLKDRFSFSDYMKDHLKEPGKGFAADEELFKYGLLVIVFYMVAFALSFYFLANKLYTIMMGGLANLFSETGYQQSLPFLNLTATILFFIALFVLSTLFCLYVAAKFMGEGLSVRLLVAQYGSVMLPFTIVNIIALGFGLAGAGGLTLFTTGVSLFFLIAIMPALLIYHRGMRSSRPLNIVYWSIGTTAASLLISYLIVRYFIVDFILQLQDVAPFL